MDLRIQAIKNIAPKQSQKCVCTIVSIFARLSFCTAHCIAYPSVFHQFRRRVVNGGGGGGGACILDRRISC